MSFCIMRDLNRFIRPVLALTCTLPSFLLFFAFLLLLLFLIPTVALFSFTSLLTGFIIRVRDHNTVVSVAIVSRSSPRATTAKLKKINLHINSKHALCFDVQPTQLLRILLYFTAYDVCFSHWLLVGRICEFVLPAVLPRFPERSEVVSQRVSVQVVLKNLKNSTNFISVHFNMLRCTCSVSHTMCIPASGKCLNRKHTMHPHRHTQTRFPDGIV